MKAKKPLQSIVLILLVLLAAGPAAASSVSQNWGGYAYNVGGADATWLGVNVGGTGEKVSSAFNLDMNLPYSGNPVFTLSLISPAGTKVMLIDNDGYVGAPGNFPEDLIPEEPLTAFVGESFDGYWTLEYRYSPVAPPGVIITLNGFTLNNPEPTGDLDDNGLLNKKDYRAMRNLIGKKIGDLDWDANADLNNDGRIWYDDLRLLTRLIRHQ